MIHTGYYGMGSDSGLRDVAPSLMLNTSSTAYPPNCPVSKWGLMSYTAQSGYITLADNPPLIRVNNIHQLYMWTGSDYTLRYAKFDNTGVGYASVLWDMPYAMLFTQLVWTITTVAATTMGNVVGADENEGYLVNSANGVTFVSHVNFNTGDVNMLHTTTDQCLLTVLEGRVYLTNGFFAMNPIWSGESYGTKYGHFVKMGTGSVTLSNVSAYILLPDAELSTVMNSLSLVDPTGYSSIAFKHPNASDF